MTQLMIRLLDETDAQEYYHLRMEGLQNHPENFAKSVDEWQQRELTEVAEELEEKDPNWTWGAFLEGEMVGIVTLARNTSEKESHKAWIKSVYVSPKARGQRLGVKLVETTVEFAEKHEDLWQLFLVVAKKNDPARTLYEKMGFEVIGEAQHSLKVGEQYIDEYIMRRELHLERTS
ncbi:GNAT family N-acetyltransferase [Risungbinella massiliensis]|uniref:GNAT family N-acetyltransferase n=1 Tax=Risungbinella massiliensis TaxID=1329796 RepID=UPI0005CC7FC9|nr:GNAT family N-acetyltransferase [Risungbinella massiliensis]